MAEADEEAGFVPGAPGGACLTAARRGDAGDPTAIHVPLGCVQGLTAGQSQMSSSSAGLFHPGSIGRVSEAETCSEQTGREKRILLSSPYAIALGLTEPDEP